MTTKRITNTVVLEDAELVLDTGEFVDKPEQYV